MSSFRNKHVFDCTERFFQIAETAPSEFYREKQVILLFQLQNNLVFHWFKSVLC